MCDTLVLCTEEGVYFAKNSDREPGEAQRVVRRPAVQDDPAGTVRVTWIEVEQVPRRFATVLSQPCWMWGAEMGANDQGVVIGNEAIFSRVVAREGDSLLGMDLVRLGLERGATAREALEVVTGLLERHGQAGEAGHARKGFRYDNSFIIADPGEAWVLETAGRHWVARRVERAAAISNRLTIHQDYDLHSAGLDAWARKQRLYRGRGGTDFARSFDTRLMPWLSGSRRRLDQGHRFLERNSRRPSLGAMIAHLSSHAGSDDPRRGGNADVCMHAGGGLRRSQTCGSMVSRLAPEGTVHLFTGTAAPCLSVFRPASFDATRDFSVLAEPGDPSGSLWWWYERVHRYALFDPDARRVISESRSQAHERILACLEPASGELPPDAPARADRIADAWAREQGARFTHLLPRFGAGAYGRFWRRRSERDGLLETPGERGPKATAE
ncbi:MAG TPA: C69 family dipeptidase [Gammaproteobacteria bacterium]|nr:C69 family dipeptidase [Gammaproteobacteria bacterium]